MGSDWIVTSPDGTPVFKSRKILGDHFYETGHWVQNPRGGSDYWERYGKEYDRTVIQGFPKHWFREVAGYPDYVAWMAQDKIFKVTTRKAYEKGLDLHFRRKPVLQSLDPDKNQGSYRLLGPTEWPAETGPWKRIGPERYPLLQGDIRAHWSYPYLERSNIPRPRHSQRRHASLPGMKPFLRVHADLLPSLAEDFGINHNPKLTLFEQLVKASREKEGREEEKSVATSHQSTDGSPGSTQNLRGTRIQSSPAHPVVTMTPGTAPSSSSTPAPKKPLGIQSNHPGPTPLPKPLPLLFGTSPSRHRARTLRLQKSKSMYDLKNGKRESHCDA
ncbi:hypothetical protein D6C98_07717 [Aureobasidium pullulans]|uniref:Uncharacterized protein n=1 Tax=Aureobasidium pullulans TaxID=5580 RepID=A0A4S9X8E0_AURPU|nr:hypothetical protein D6C98_07717 [Aureobasidium pullulans]THZ74960.1 hypothetical protein D6C85_03173 [Aureobasidium pullulans]